MRIICAEGIHHPDGKGKRSAIYSVDVQPYDQRLATASGDCTVRLWSLSTLLASHDNENNESSPSSSLFLASLTGHTKSANVVRWSKNGKYLASGGDDTYILIHKHSPHSTFSNQTAFGATKGKPALSRISNNTNLETWQTCVTLQGHTMDVLDLDWSSSGGWLASASVDNSVLLWHLLEEEDHSNNGGNLLAYIPRILGPTHRLQQHTSFVKGVSFDPMGKFLVSCGDDKVIHVWDMSHSHANGGNHHQSSIVYVSAVTDILQESSDKVMFRRISWAPDGSALSIISARDSKQALYQTPILRRNDWQRMVALAGYAPSTASKFCPYLFQTIKRKETENDAEDDELFCLIAVGDQTGVLTLWSSQKVKPIMVLTDLCSGPISDISWSVNNNVLKKNVQSGNSTVRTSCGMDVNSLQLVVSAISGEIVVLEFDLSSGDLGEKMLFDPSKGNSASNVRLTKHYEDLYGIGCALPRYQQVFSSSNECIGANSGASAVTGVAIATVVDRVNTAFEPQTTTSTIVTATSTVSYMESGKKRIRPVLLDDTAIDTTGSAVTIHTAPVQQTAVSNSTINPVSMASSTVSVSNAVGPSRTELLTQRMASNVTSNPVNSSANASKRIKFADNNNIQSSSNNNNNSNSSSNCIAVSNMHRVIPTTMNSSNISQNVASSLNHRVLNIQLTNDSISYSTHMPSLLSNLQSTVSELPVISFPNNKNNHSNNNYNNVSKAVLKLESLTPPARLVPSHTLTGTNSHTNPTQHPYGTLSRLSYINETNSSTISASSSASILNNNTDDKYVWSMFLLGDVTVARAFHFSSSLGSATFTGGIVCVGHSDGSLSLYHLSTGIAVTPPLLLGGAVCVLDLIPLSSHANQHHYHNFHQDTDASQVYKLYALTCDGCAYLWHITVTAADKFSLSTSTLHSSSTSTPIMSIRLSQRIDLRPLLLSLRASVTSQDLSSNKEDKVHHITLHVAQSYLHPLTKEIILGASVTCTSPSNNTSSSSTNNNNNTNAKKYVFQLCQFSELMGCWQRLSDSRYALCSVLTPSSANSNSAQWPSSLSHLVDLAVSRQHSGVTQRDIVRVSQAKQQETQQLRMSTTSLPPNHPTMPASMTVEEWCLCVSLAHAEERLTAFLCLYQQSQQECDTAKEEHIGSALQEVVRLSVLLRHWTRVTHLCDTLLQQQQQQVGGTSMGDTTAGGGVSGVSLPRQMSDTLFRNYVLPALSSFVTKNNNTAFHTNNNATSNSNSYTVAGETLEMVENLVAALQASV